MASYISERARRPKNDAACRRYNTACDTTRLATSKSQANVSFGDADLEFNIFTAQYTESKIKHRLVNI